VPAEMGGAGLHDRRYADLVVESLATVGALGTALAVGFHSGVALPALLARPSRAFDNLIAAAAVGADVIAIANLEGSIHIESTPGGQQVLVGTSAAVVNAAVADHFMLLLDDGIDGSVILLVAADRVVVQPPTKLLGMPESGCRNVTFKSIELAEEMVIGRGVDRSTWFADIAMVISTACIEAARVAVRQTVEYVCERQVFGRPLAEFENTRGVLGGLHAEATVVAACHREYASVRQAGEAGDSNVAALVVRSAALLDRAVDQCLQLHGGYGYMREYPIAHAFAAARQILLIVDRLSPVQQALEAAVGLHDS